MQKDLRFELERLSFDGPCIIKHKKIGDDRGYLERLFCGQELVRGTGFNGIAQINRTFTKQIGVLRGMHFQFEPNSEAKIIQCLRGKICDVIVDIRSGSPTFLKHIAVQLSADDSSALFVPRGFAHGFQTLQSDTELLYFHDNYYKKDSECGLNPLDASLRINWPLEISLMSERDRSHPLITENFKGVML